MKIKSLEINNFRSIKYAKIEMADFNAFVGPNGSGKSTALHALNLFFGDLNSVEESDFHKKDVTEPIIIRVVFCDLGVQAKEDFKHYVRAGLLTVQMEVSIDEAGKTRKTVRGERLVFEPLIPFFEASTAGDRSRLFNEVRAQFPSIASATNDDGRRASILSFEEGVPDEEKKFVLSGSDFFGVSKGVHKFQRHLNWVYIPAVKDASAEGEEAKTSYLGRLIQHTVRAGMDYQQDLLKIRNEAVDSYNRLIESQKSHLEVLERNLASRLQDVVTTDADLKLEWKKDDKSVQVLEPIANVELSDKGFWGKVDKFGHGLQRAFLLVLLQELMTVDSEVTPTLIFGCEEPELYQHPPQARHLAAILHDLSMGDAQVLVTTHSPYFVNVEHYEGIKMFRSQSGETKITKSSFSDVLTSYNSAFGRELRDEDQVRTKLAIQTQPKFNEVFFADKVILVEGISDQVCLETFLRLSGKSIDFKKRGASIIICEGKSSLALMLLMVKDFQIPFHVVFDLDAGKDPKYHEEHKKDNTTIFSLLGMPERQGFLDAHLFEDKVTAWFDDIEEVLTESFGDKAERCRQAGRNAVGNLKDAKKNPLYISAAMSAAWQNGIRFDMLDRVISNALK